MFVRIVVLAILATHVFFLWAVRDRIARGDPDFTVFYTAGNILRQGRGAELYNASTQEAVQRQFTANSDIRRGPLPYIHPPFEALVFLPLTFLPYSAAFVLWNLINLGMLCAVWFLLRSSIEILRRIRWWELLLLSLAFFPIFATFHQGQDAILLLLVLALAFRALHRNADLVAGCWLGFGVFKYHLILPLVLVLILWRGRRLAYGFGATGFSMIFISLGLVGWHAALLYPSFTLRIVSETGFGAIPFRQLPNIAGVLGGWPHVEDAGWPLQAGIVACAIAVLVAVGCLRNLARQTRFANLCIACAVVAALLVGYNTNTYDLSLLILPLTLVADYCSRELRGNERATAIILPTVPLLISPLWFFLWMGWQRINLIAVFLIWWLFAIRAEILRRDSERDAGPSIVTEHA
jgi:Glycosyltransferase family 87